MAGLAGLLLAPAHARASGACEGETGRAFGMCQAYCEALDCDGDPNADAQACSNVGSHFTSLTGRELPCETVVEPPDVDCPCLAFEGWSGAFAPTVEAYTCWEGLSGSWYDSETGFEAWMSLGTIEIEDYENDTIIDLPVCGVLEWWEPESEAVEYEIVLETQAQIDGCAAYLAAWVEAEDLVCQ